MPNAELSERRARLEVARDTFHSSGRRVDTLRGRDINATLILNAGRLNSYRETTREIYRRVNAVIAGVILELPHNCVIAHVEHYDEFIYFWLPVISLGDPRMCYLHDPPPLPQNKEYTENEVPAPHAPDAKETAPTPSLPSPSHPPSAMRAATSAAKSQNGDKKPKSTSTH